MSRGAASLTSSGCLQRVCLHPFFKLTVIYTVFQQRAVQAHFGTYRDLFLHNELSLIINNLNLNPNNVCCNTYLINVYFCNIKVPN